jgi:hypothetical protein
MILASLAILAVLGTARACPVSAATALPELTGTWEVLRISGLDRPRPDSAMAHSTFVPELQNCLIREQIRDATGNPPYEGLILWGVNGADGSIQRVFTHSQHGRFGIYEGRRAASTITLRQLPISAQPSTDVVENQLLISDAGHFALVSRISSDSGATWRTLSRWDYRRASS